MTDEIKLINGFEELGLAPAVLKVLNDVGYETPTPIQEQIIPEILSGQDVVGQAQTGTGKTAAFALPLLSRINMKLKNPQVLVLTPTRELAIQVAESFQRYAGRMNGFHVLPIYGGQDYERQFRRLKQGTHVVVGTPGRVMDHIRRNTLHLDMLSCLILDEADEMLRMGFIDDVEWILDQTPGDHQIALFSATIPPPIRKIAKKYLKDPVSITIKAKTATVEATRHRHGRTIGKTGGPRFSLCAAQRGCGPTTTRANYSAFKKWENQYYCGNRCSGKRFGCGPDQPCDQF
jgi:ATP-dependent RNA helicase DeaD